MRKQDEMEKYQSDKAAKYGFIFYTITLLIWSIYNQITSKGDGGWAHIILMGGVALYFLTRVVLNRKMNN
ncbi:hypothetical protein [Lysinibacillus sp. NPDC092081]|uniref:hypothetical protein n=1 Tax=Lysinibacillus TaxID=400634 RepID=UPI00382E1247